MLPDPTASNALVRVREYHLSAEGTTIVYVTEPSGEPRLECNGTTYRGRQIHLEETELGPLRSVALKAGEHLSLLLPEAYREANAKSVNIATFVIFSTRDPSLDGATRSPVRGQLRQYRVLALSGNAW